MPKAKANEFPLGFQDSKRVNVAVQRPTVNVREAENLGEQAAAEAKQPVKNNLTKSGWGEGHLHDLFS
jgi:hypothetical protein